MGVGAGLYIYVVVVQKFTFAISSPDEFLLLLLGDVSLWAGGELSPHVTRGLGRGLPPYKGHLIHPAVWPQ